MADASYLGWPFFDASHRELKRGLDAWCHEHAKLLGATHEELDRSCEQLAHALGEAGWLRYTVPAAYGGATEQLDVRSLSLIRETLAYHSGLADFVFAMQGLGSAPITLFGTEAQKSAYLPAVATGEKIAAFALSEAEAGSDVSALAMTARRDAARLVLDGEKTWISNGGLAAFYTVFARTGEAPGTRGLSAVVVDAGLPGFDVKERIELIAPHPIAKLAFEDVSVPASQLLGEPGTGFKIAMATLDVFRTTVGAAALGFARRAMDETTAHVNRRVLFGGVLADLQLTQAAVADMAVDIDASALLVYRSGWTKDQNQTRVTREAAMAKLHATERAQQVVDRAVQLLGGRGVVAGETVARLYQEIRALRIYEGASEVQKIIIARQVLDGVK
jgi:acyl-CoA dehydrogenase